jgi:hypothetical protein
MRLPKMKPMSKEERAAMIERMSKMVEESIPFHKEQEKIYGPLTFDYNEWDRMPLEDKIKNLHESLMWLMENK